MSIHRPRIHPMLAGVIAGVVIFAVVGVMAWININFAAPWSSTHTLTVQTTDADGIAVSSDVRINGRLVGQVTGVEAKGQTSDVTIHVDDSEWPLPASTTASVRLATLLGQKYIQLEPPPQEDGGPTLADGATIKGGKPVVDFDQILDTFDKPTREALRGILVTGGNAVANQEGTLQNLLPDFADLNQHSQVPTGELAGRDESLNSILVNLGTVADQLGQSREDLAGVIDNMNRLTGALAQHAQDLRSFINQGDQLSITTDRVLGGGYAARLAADLPKVDEIVHDLNTTFSEVYPQTLSFKKYAAGSTITLIYEIGDATSQSDHDGYWLRQNLQTLDFSNLGVGSPTGASGPPAPPGSASTAKPGTTLPTLPAPGPVCVVGVCLGGGSGTQSGGSGGGTGGGGSTGGTCLLGVICTSAASYGYTATPPATSMGDGSAGSWASDGTPWYAPATFALWEGA